MRFISTLSFCIFLVSTSLLAQTKLPLPVNYLKAYKSGSRTYTGMPGKPYWQNKADYRITVDFDPAAAMLAGELDAEYHNESPDTLKQLVLKLYPNLYQKESMRNIPVQPEDLTDGVDIQSLEINAQTYTGKKHGTNLYVKGAIIDPGKTAHIHIRYNYPVNKGSFIRTGRVDSGSYMIAYFFPRIAVYDDIDGWNEYPYAGREEFYNDYGSFEVAIRLPGDYMVWATGELQNPSEVYSTDIVDRINTARHSDSIIDIITTVDLQSAGSISSTAPPKTWRFKAENVTDFAFALSNHYIWKASSVMVDPSTHRRVEVDAVYDPLDTAFNDVVNYARKTVEFISYKIPGIPFPYPHETIFEGLDAMEYPMMVNDRPFEGIDAVQFTAHEVFHTLFPFWVGINETKYSFMDEGWATFAEFTLLQYISPGSPEGYDLSSVNESAGSDQDVPVMTLTPQLYGKARFADKDLKPALALHYLREMLGDSIFCQATQYYIRQWQGRHPTPFDFFACMSKGAGQDLDWFWQNWYFEKNVPDLAIGRVEAATDAAYVQILRKREAMVPIHLHVQYTDGTSCDVNRSVACWRRGAHSVTLQIPGRKKIKTLQLGNAYDADTDLNNNRWPATRSSPTAQ